ncbi:hypothetical protein SLE2022_120200 [Rubroshorea leprosula]
MQDHDEDTYNELKINVKFDKCMRAKQIVIKELEGNFIEEYGNVVGYARYLEFVNLGNKVRVVVDRPRTSGPFMFQGIYVCLKVLRDGWKNACKPLIGVNGCFVKGVCKGVLLSVVGRDGNEQMYPIA